MEQPGAAGGASARDQGAWHIQDWGYRGLLRPSSDQACGPEDMEVEDNSTCFSRREEEQKRKRREENFVKEKKKK